MPRHDRPRVLLIWPGGIAGGGGNFGLPQLLSIASQVRRVGAEVTVVDLDLERARTGRIVDLASLCRGPDGGGYQLVGIGCYSSFDYLKVMAIGAAVRASLPRAWIATGGYHPSARPHDFTGEESPFDFVIVGDGERPMQRLAEAIVTGRRPLQRVLGPESTPAPDELEPYDWSLLDAYRPIARKVASQAEIYLSRGCPYDCAFCMERAKRDVSWRALSVDRALDELHRLDAWLDLSGWTLFVADALFGMKQSWRRALLEGLAKKPLRARKIWLLIRLDLIEDEDVALMARANVAPGFGLESGDPEQIRRIRKVGRLSDYLDQMVRVAELCHRHHVPFGANVIVGHPGETERSLRTSARYLSKLFLDDPRGTMGFLSVDPFRLYPGSPIDEARADWERDTGMRVHRYPWWHDGDQDFLASWVDPSAELSFRRCLELRHELFAPIVAGVASRFAYRGPSRGYFMRAVDEQVELAKPRQMLHTLGLWHLWRGLVGESSEPHASAIAADDGLASIARAARTATLETSPALAGIAAPIRRALATVRRERYVLAEDVGHSADDHALSLVDDALEGATADEPATISAMHAYARAFAALELREGDSLVELGGGSGYGAAVARELVGPNGKVTTIEWSETLASRARALLPADVEVMQGDAHDVERWRGARKVYVAFALSTLPDAWIEALADGGALVAPIGSTDRQTLTLARKVDGRWTQTALESVRYVADRSPLAPPSPTPTEGSD